jgi:carbamoyltransferase
MRARVPHEGGGYLLAVNQDGFRCRHEFSARRAPGVRRVLLFGDSFTAGIGVSDDVRFGDRLESLIERLEVYNFGLPGTGCDQQYLSYLEFAEGLERDLVTIAVLVENIRRVVAHYRVAYTENGVTRCVGKPYFELTGGELVLRNSPPPSELIAEEDLPVAEQASVDRGGRFPQLRGLINQLGMRDLAQRVTHYQPVPEYEDPEHPAWQVMRAILIRWITSIPGTVLLVPLPLYQHVEEICDARAYQARFREVAAAAGCVLHDPLPDLLAYSSAERRGFRFGQDWHPTTAGHAALAGSLAPIVRRLLGDPHHEDSQISPGDARIRNKDRAASAAKPADIRTVGDEDSR